MDVIIHFIYSDLLIYKKCHSYIQKIEYTSYEKYVSISEC